MGMGDAVLSLLNNITVQPINGPQTNNNGSGNEVGTSQRVSDIVGVLAGENQVEFTITPSVAFDGLKIHFAPRSEEHTSELQSLLRLSYAVFCLKKNHHTQTCTTILLPQPAVTQLF